MCRQEGRLAIGSEIETSLRVEAVGSVHGASSLENPQDDNNGYDDQKEMDQTAPDRKNERPQHPAQEQYHNDRFEHDTRPLLMLIVPTRITPALTRAGHRPHV